ncbi:MAG: PAS domain S-box protein [Candidatus Heimdallarchaeota archaeon]|nr:PAS domain S-box protein [Candidatus Heimdallarchaeota archaeon]
MSEYIPLANDLNRVVNAAPIVVFQVDKQGIFTLSEGASLSTLGLKPGQVVGLSVYEVYKDFPDIIEAFRTIFTNGKDIRFTSKLSNSIYFDTQMTAIIENGEILGINGVATNISEKEVLARKLQQSEERYRVVAESAPFGILIMQKAVVSYANRKYVNIFGYDSIDEIIGRNGVDFLVPQVREKLLQRALSREEGNEEPQAYESIGLKKSGEEFPMRVNMQRITYMGEPAIMGFFQDITEEKGAEEQNEKIMKQMMHTQKLESLGVLAGGIAHDFNNLLVGIMGNATLISSKLEEGNPLREYINQIEHTSKLASDLTRQMLAYSGRGQFLKEVISLKDLILEYDHLIRASISKTNELIYRLDDDLPLIEVDTTQIRQVLLNLVSNASESITHNQGVIIISLSKLKFNSGEAMKTFQIELKPGEYLLLEVQDNGAGIEQDIIERIFDPFYSTKFTGRGLGLAVVQGIIKGHSGAIKVSSEINKGTTFKVLIPVGENLKKVEKEEQVVTLNQRGRILICDDEKIVREVAANMLSDLGFEILYAIDGQHAVEMYDAHSHEIDLILLDLTMPKLSGEQVFKHIRKHDPHVKIIISSGFNEKEVVNRFSGKQFSAFLQKPYGYKDLIYLINQLMN